MGSQRPLAAQKPLHIESLGLIVLAAGASSRMGRPKALIELDGRKLIEHLLAPKILDEFGDVVVVGHHREHIGPLVERRGFRCVENPDPDRGRTGSVQLGIAALVDHIIAAFVQPVDCPLILPSTYTDLAAGIGGHDVAVPVYDNENGHPPLLGVAAMDRIRQASPDRPLRELIRAKGLRRCTISVNDPGALLNIDRPEDLGVLTERYAAYRNESEHNGWATTFARSQT